MSYQFSKYETHYRNLTYLGVPIIIGQLGNLILNFADTLMIGHHSTEELAAAVAVRISNFMGQRDYLAVRRTATAGINLVFLLAILTSVPIFICRHIIGGLFTDNVNVISMVSMTIIPFMIYQFGDGLQCNYANAMRGTANVRPLIWIAFVSFFIVSLPLGYLFGVVMNYQLVGVWFAFPFGLTLSGVLYYIYYQKGLKKIESGAKT